MTEPEFYIEFTECVQRSLGLLKLNDIYAITRELVDLRARGGRLFIIGNGGGAAHASHAAADFRTLCGIEAYCPSDNAANLTALANDEGWDNAYENWLRLSMRPMDALLVISVGGGNESRSISTNVVNAVRLAKILHAPVLGVVGRDGGYAARNSTASVVIPCDHPEWTTPVVEGLQAVILHLIVTELAVKKPKWESTDA